MQVTWAKAGESGNGISLTTRLGLHEREAKCVFVFASPQCDLTALGAELASLDTPVIACTTAGQIGADGFEHGGVTAAAVFDELEVHSFAIASLSDLETSVDRAYAAIQASGVLATKAISRFGVVLVDGLAMAEERLMAALHRRLPRIPVVGGSAGDERAFQRTQVFVDGEFRSDAAVLHIFTSPRRIAPLKLQHHVPTAQRLVITAATPGDRTIQEIDGLPAIEAYARAIGLPPDQITDAIVAQHPLMLRIGDEHYIRSIRQRRADGGLEMSCAIERGLVVRVGQAVDIVETIEAAFARAAAQVGDVELVLGYDCISRRLEIEQAQLTERVGALFASHRVIGFSTYGEQWNATHANQTFVGIMIGAAP